MKTVYVPKGESRSYEYLDTDNLVVNGHLNVVNSVKAKRILGHGFIAAGMVSCNEITANEIETATIVCKRLMAKRICAAEVFASDSATVSCFLSAAYVETGKLTTAYCEVDEVKADEVINLTTKKRGMLMTLLLSALRSLWLRLTVPHVRDETDADPGSDKEDSENPETDETETDDERAMREEIGRIVREALAEQAAAKTVHEDDEDFELKRFISTFKLLRDQGYTLRIIPGTPEENAPVYDFSKEKLIRPAA